MSIPEPETYFLPQYVGKEFVRHYYKVLNKSPQLVYRLYGPESVLKYSTSIVASGLDAIRTIIEKQRFRNVKGTVMTLDCQDTNNNGVVIQSSGILSNNGRPERPFTETFVLAALSPRKYYILNHVFGYDDGMRIDDVDYVGDSDYNTNQFSYYEADITYEQQHNMAQVVVAADFSVPPPPFSFFDSCVSQAQSLAEMHHEGPKQVVPNRAATFEEFLMRIQDSNVPMDTSRSQHSMLSSVTLSEFQPQQTSAYTDNFCTILERQEPDMDGTGQQDGDSYPNMFKATTPRAIDFMNAAQQHQQQDHFLQQMAGYQADSSSTYDQLYLPSTSLGTFGSTFPMNMSSGPHQRNNSRMHNRSRVFRDNQQLFLGNIPHHASEDELKVIFQRFGNIVELRVLSKQGAKSTQGQRNPLNYGFLTYENEESVQACLTNCPIYFPENSPHGKKLNVEIKKPRNRSNDLQRNRNQASSLGDNDIITSPHNISNGPSRQQQHNNGRNRMRRNNSASGPFNRNENRGNQPRRGGANFTGRH